MLIKAAAAALELPRKMAEAGRDGVLPPELLLAPGLVIDDGDGRDCDRCRDKENSGGVDIAGDDMMYETNFGPGLFGFVFSRLRPASAPQWYDEIRSQRSR